jgi:short-subunit dehydrogenase
LGLTLLGARIINCTSVTAYHGKPNLLDYSSTKGAIVSFTRSLARQLGPSGISGTWAYLDAVDSIFLRGRGIPQFFYNFSNRLRKKKVFKSLWNMAKSCLWHVLDNP